MRWLYVVFFGLINSFSACNYFIPVDKNSQTLDTIIDFESVDLSPSFFICDALSGEDRTNCFRTKLQEKIANALQKHALTVEEDIDEMITVFLTINRKGKVELKEIKRSQLLKETLSSLDSLIDLSIKRLPRVSPAIKRGIAVNTEYQLPIRVSINNSDL